MATQPQTGDLRGLKALVGILGVLIVLGTALVIGVIIHRLYAKPSAPSTTAAATASVPAYAPAPGMPLPPSAIANRLPEGDYIKSIAAAGADVAIWVAGPEGDRILLFNPATGRLTVAVSAAQ
jgi:hypothetical protein